MEANEVVARRFFDQVWTRGRYDVVDELLTSNHEHHISGDTTIGPEAVTDMARSLRSALPDLEFIVEETLAKDDKVLVRWVARGTHRGTLGGLDGTGRRVEWTGMDLIRFRDGRIVEIWGNNDALGLFEQME